MGFFDIFKKKECDICGGEIGLLGNRKLEDGNMCKTCAKKLSPWFDDRRHSTLEQIKAQLAYRQENEKAVAAFNVTRTIGRDCLVSCDENARKFMVVMTKDIAEENPDVLDYSQVTGVDLDVNESTTEIMREVKDSDGQTKRESYFPRRWLYEYDFYVVIRVRHPYFDDMRFRLNPSTVRIEYTEPSTGFLGLSVTTTTHPTESVRYREYSEIADEIRQVLMDRTVAAPSEADKKFGQEMEESNTIPQPPKATVTCSYCNAQITSVDGVCGSCGAKL